MRITACLAFLFLEMLGSAQDVRKYTLAQIIQVWANPEFDTSEILIAIDNANLVLDFNESNLASVLDGAHRGNRTPSQTAQVVLRLMRDCRNCRNQFWAPLGPDDLINALAKGSPYAMDDLRVRGTSGFPLSLDFIKDLRAAGATPDLIAAVEDRLRISPPVGFKPMRLDKAADFNPLASEGRLTVRVIMDGAAIFLFRHNALWVKDEKGADPKNLGSTFTAFGPASRPIKTFTGQLAQDPKLKKVKMHTEAVMDPSGRSGLQFTLDNLPKGPHEYGMELRWVR
jgi:hypothetical protein